MKKILGVKIDNLSEKEILERIEGSLANSGFCHLATINPELILEAERNEEFRNILNSCDLCVADGFGIKCAFWKKFSCLKCRLPGVDLAEKILEIAQRRGEGVFLACRKSGLSNFQEIKDMLQKKYPKLEIRGEDIDIRNPKTEGKIEEKILMCNFGAPEQEFFIQKQKNDTIRLAIGVGGTFDFWTGKIKRAPKFMRRIGLEWLWRLFQEPRYRCKRIFRAVVIFPIKVLLKKD